MSGIRVTYSGLISFATGLFTVFTGLIFSFIVTRLLSPQEFGTWNLINSLLWYGLIFDPIISYWATRETARGIESGKTAILSSGIFSMIGIFVYIISAYFVAPQSHADQNILFLAVILLPVSYVYKVLAGINLGWKPQANSYATLLSEIVKISTAFIFIYVLQMRLEGVILAYLLAYVTNSLIQYAFARGKIRGNIKKEFLKKWLGTFWISMYPRLGTIFLKSDVVIFSVITGSVIGIAYYAAANVIASIVSSATGISSSAYSKLLEEDKRGFVQENIIRLFYFAIPLVALSITFAREGLLVLNPLYEVAVPVVILMAIQTFLLVLNSTFYSFLMGIETVDVNRESTFKDYAKSKLFVLPTWSLIQLGTYLVLLTTALLLLGTKTHSQIDLVIYWSIITVITNVPLTTYLYIMVRKNFSINLDFSILKYVLISTVVFGTIYFFAEKLLNYKKNIFEFIPDVLLFVGLGIASYLIITYLIDLRTRKLFKAIIFEIKGQVL